MEIMETQQVIARGHSEVSLVAGKDILKTVEKDHEAVVEVPKDAFAKVGVRREFTKNLGNYQSIKGGVWIEMPSGLSPSEIKNTYDSIGLMVSNLSAVELKDAIEWSDEVGLN